MPPSLSKSAFLTTPCTPARGYHTYRGQIPPRLRKTFPSLEAIIPFLTLNEAISLFSINTILWENRARYPLAFDRVPYPLVKVNTALGDSSSFSAHSLWLSLESSRFSLKPALAARVRNLVLTREKPVRYKKDAHADLEVELPGLEELAKCSNLTKLRSEGFFFSSLSTLSQMLKLADLELSGSHIPPSEKLLLSSLRRLRLSDVAVEDLSFLSECHNLIALILNECIGLNSMNGLTQLSELRYFELHTDGETKLKKDTLKGLVACSKLETLILSGVRFKELSFLARLSHLQRLDLDLWGLGSDLSFLRGCPQLAELKLQVGAGLLNLNGLEYGVSLKKIMLKCAAYPDLSLLQECKELRHLEIANANYNNSTASLEGLANLEKLETLIIISSGLLPEQDILPGCPNLRSFCFTGDWIEPRAVEEVSSLERLEISVRRAGSFAFKVSKKLRQLSIFAHNVSLSSTSSPNLEELQLTARFGPIPNLKPFAKIKKLTLESAAPFALSFLEYFGQLEFLQLRGSETTSFQLPAPLPSLRRLVLLSMQYLKKVSSFAEYPNLEFLQLQDMRELVKIAPFTELTNLKQLKLVGLSKLQTLPTLANKTRLEEVELSALDLLKVLPECGGCLALERFQLLATHHLHDLSGLRNCPKLKKVSLLLKPYIAMGKPVELKQELSASATLEGCPSVTELKLGGCARLFDYSAIANLVELRSLLLEESAIYVPLALERCRNLARVELDLTSPLLNQDLTFLRGCTELTHLYFYEAAFTGSLKGIRTLPLLTDFLCDSAGKITTLAGIAGCTNLNRLRLRSSGLTSLAGLTNVPNLRCLDLSSSANFDSLAGVGGCNNLESIILYGTKVKDPLPLLECKLLSIALLPATVSVEQLKSSAPKLHLFKEDEREDESEEEESEEEEGDEGED